MNAVEAELLLLLLGCLRGMKGATDESLLQTLLSRPFTSSVSICKG